MLSQEIRKKFLQYFQSQKHKILPSSSVIPHDDPSLLFVNAGMNQFKDIFLGNEKPDYTRAVTSQKCIRVGGKHNDLENVGYTSRHLTFFEMLGNFSFGDYFKEEALAFAWHVSVEIFQFEKEKIWASIYEEDDEAYEMWKKYLPENRIVRLGKKDNFWEMGDVGPCGPCSELLYDRGDKFSDASSPLYDLQGERFIEYWNLVFMQYNKDEKGLLTPLPHRSIDTGAGLERIISIKMHVDDVFHTDILRALITAQEKLFHQKYDDSNKDKTAAFHVIADHLRSLCFAIADGALPSNIERGYVLRKLLRRAVRYGKFLGQQKPFLASLVTPLISLMGEDYPELSQAKNLIEKTLTNEEEMFFQTLKKGGNLLTRIIENSREKISGDDAFKLKDTYGFPLEEILLLAKDAHLEVDLVRFEKLEKEAKEKSKKAHKKQAQMFHKNLFEDFVKKHPPTVFVGHDKIETQSPIIGIIADNTFTDTVKEKQEAVILLEKTPFYAEAGGQIGDIGTLQHNGALFEVNNTFYAYGNYVAHEGHVVKGTFHKKDTVTAQIDSERRKNISNNHTATHLLHWALYEILGEHIQQTGSLVTDQRLRFDFSHTQSLSQEEIRKIESLINQKIRCNLPVIITTKKYEEIKNDSSVKKIFTEKYDEQVRVIDFAITKELCGGTHAKHLGDIGFFKIIKEGSIAKGIRRIEAVTGSCAEHHVYHKEDFIVEIASQLKTDEAKILVKLENIVEENKELLKKVRSFQEEKSALLTHSLLPQIQHINGIAFLAKMVDVDSKELISLAENLQQKTKSLCLILATQQQDRCHLLISLSDDLLSKKISAMHILQEISPLIEAKGGGRDNLVQAKVTKSQNLQQAFTHIEQYLKSL